MLALNSELFLVESAELHDDLVTQHVHTDLKIHARGHVDPEVVRLKHGGLLDALRRDLDERVVVVQLVVILLLLLPQGEREV